MGTRVPLVDVLTASLNHDAENRASVAGELAGTGAPAWMVPLLVEIRGPRGEVGDLVKEVRGGGPSPGHAEQLRQLDGRVARLERACNWLGAIGTAIVTTLGGAWAIANVHLGNTPPPGHP